MSYLCCPLLSFAATQGLNNPSTLLLPLLGQSLPNKTQFPPFKSVRQRFNITYTSKTCSVPSIPLWTRFLSFSLRYHCVPGNTDPFVRKKERGNATFPHLRGSIQPAAQRRREEERLPFYWQIALLWFRQPNEYCKQQLVRSLLPHYLIFWEPWYKI